MKKLLSLIGLLLFLSYNHAVETQAQVVVKVRPNRPAVLVSRPAKAKGGHVWVDGHWHHNGSQYIWVKGHWKAEKKGHNWVPGKWVACKGGHNWVVGHWAPVKVVATPKRKVVVKKKHRHGKHHHH